MSKEKVSKEKSSLRVGSRIVATMALFASGSGSSVVMPASEISDNTTNNGALIIDGHPAPFTRHEINTFYELDPLGAEACDPSSDGYVVQDCLDIYNLCNANPQKPVESRVIGCFENNAIIKDSTGAIIGVIQELTGFDSNGDSSYPLYYPEK